MLKLKIIVLIIAVVVVLILIGLGILGYYTEKNLSPEEIRQLSPEARKEYLEKHGKRVAEVKISQESFNPQNVEISVGKALCFRNFSKEASLTLVFPEFKSPAIQPNSSWCRIFRKAGDFEYYLEQNPEIKGEVIIKQVNL